MFPVGHRSLQGTDFAPGCCSWCIASERSSKMNKQLLASTAVCLVLGTAAFAQSPNNSTTNSPTAAQPQTSNPSSGSPSTTTQPSTSTPSTTTSTQNTPATGSGAQTQPSSNSAA